MLMCTIDYVPLVSNLDDFEPISIMLLLFLHTNNPKLSSFVFEACVSSLSFPITKHSARCH